MIIALILTPVALATQPAAPQDASGVQAVSVYNWEAQTGSPKAPSSYGTYTGTNSYVNMSYVIDDWNSD